MMLLLLSSLGFLFAAGCLSWAAGKAPRLSTALGTWGMMIGGLAGLIPAVWTLSTGTPLALQLPWAIPSGSLSLGLDALSAFFLLPVLVLSILTALFGGGYMSVYFNRRPIGAHWFFFNLLVAGMVLVLLARNGILFLMAWEIMSLAAFFLVTFEHEKPKVQEAGWIYLIAAQAGAAFLLALFVGLGLQAGSQDFSRFLAHRPISGSGFFFLLALVGFGAKAGFAPLHVWLPEAHPAAPSHVSALMSGAMIKMGLYGLLRSLSFLGYPSAWWAYALMGIGLTSALMGILLALAQSDLKRALAYSSVENVGLIAFSLGIGLLGLNLGSPLMSALGFGGALLHIVNHACFKGLLFLAAGSVLHGAGAADTDSLGGLLKRMPWTGLFFLIGAASICGFPPFNGFVSEFLIYLASLQGAFVRVPAIAGLLLISTAVLAMIGGLAAAVFAKAFGGAFLGEPRTPAAALAHEAGWRMRFPMALLACGCILLAVFGPALIQRLIPVISVFTSLDPGAGRAELAVISGWLTPLTVFACLLAAAMAVVFAFRRRLLKRRKPADGLTWDCGYALPTPRMEYTASSFSQPLAGSFSLFLNPRRRYSPPKGLFPSASELQTQTPEPFRRFGFDPLFRMVRDFFSRGQWLQHGRVQLYVLYIALTLLLLLLWKLR